MRPCSSTTRRTAASLWSSSAWSQAIATTRPSGAAATVLARLPPTGSADEPSVVVRPVT